MSSVAVKVPKDPKRKGKLRPKPRRTDPVDEDLHDLAVVLSEFNLDNNAYGWFRPPWRNGEWAAGLAKHVAEIVEDPGHPSGTLLCGLAWNLIDSPRASVGAYREHYEKAGQLYNQLVAPHFNTDRTRLTAAALRCLQLKIANSDGGGAVYNEVLIPAFLPIEPALVERAVLEFRCNDSIGTTSVLQGDHNDRQRHAFTIAWRRGLYLAAYSIPPAY